MFEGEYIRLTDKGLAPPPRVFGVDELHHFGKWAGLSGVLPEGPGGRRFGLADRPWLRPLYDETRDAVSHRRVYMKAAQMGLTTRMLYRAMWLTADSDTRANVALMFPTASDVQDLNKTRFRPAIRSSAKMLELISDVDAVEVVRIGVSNMRFRGMRSGVGMDSFPADMLLFDEVRLMDRASIERVFYRLTDSAYIDARGNQGIIELNSTAGFPDEDIHYYFKQSTMHTWHAFCRTHGAIDVAEAFPECVDTRTMRYVCPRCGNEIHPERGDYIRLGSEDAPWQGYAFNQLAKGKTALPGIMQQFDRMVIQGVNPSEFYNSTLGRPHQDPDAVLVPPAVFDRSIGLEPNYTAPIEGTNWNPDGYPVTMGIDQRGVEKHVSVWRWGAMGRMYLVYLETVEASGAAAVGRCEHLFKAWHCDLLVVDAYPSYDFARDLARKLPRGKTYLAEYHGSQIQPIEWLDGRERDNKKTRRSSGEAKYSYLVTINRYLHLLQWLMMWVNGRVVLPANAADMVQERTLNSLRMSVQQVFDMQNHFRNIARVNVTRLERNPETGESMDTGSRRYTFRNLALDPHWVHSSGYALAGLMRQTGTTQLFHGLRTQEPKPVKTYRAQITNVLPDEILTHSKKTCGGCRFFDNPQGTPMGTCMNKKLQLEHGASAPLRTPAKATSCKYWRKPKH